MALSRSELREVLSERGLRPSRALGQNFVVDQNTLRRVVRLAGVVAGDHVVEIGAGLGALTVELATVGAQVIAVEIDSRLVPLLRERTEPLGVRVVEADAMTIDFNELLAEAGAGVTDEQARRCTLVANLPYNIAVPLIIRVLDEAPIVSSMLVMVQREVGERLAAAPGGSAYGAVTVKVAYHAEARIVGSVPPSVFVPRPRVSSALVRMDRRDAVAVDPTIVPPDGLFSLVRAGFAHRRKMLRGALSGLVTVDDFAAAGIDPRCRAQELSVERWGRLAAAVLEKRGA